MAELRTIYLVRHAIAEERGDAWPDDSKRPLTHAGVARMRLAIEGLRALDVEPDVVLTSPFVRAVQTAELLVEGLRPRPSLQRLPALAPGGSCPKVGDAVAGLPPDQSVALVGHEPGLGELAAWLLGARWPPRFKKGGVCRIDLAGGGPARGGQLVWFATPKMLRALAEA